MLSLPVFSIFATVAQESEVIECDAGHLLKDSWSHYLVEVAEFERSIVVGHDETRDGT